MFALVAIILSSSFKSIAMIAIIIILFLLWAIGLFEGRALLSLFASVALMALFISEMCNDVAHHKRLIEFVIDLFSSICWAANTQDSLRKLKGE